MKPVKLLGRIILQIAAVGVFLNGPATFAACAMPVELATESGHQTPPCHTAAKSSATETVELEEENCCAVCVPIAIHQQQVATAPVVAQALSPQSLVNIPSSGLDPPFRPPAIILS